MTNQIPPRRNGIRHLLAAVEYSVAGLRRLLQESAFRHELAGGMLALAVLLVGSAPVARIVVFLMMFCLLLAVEALNTAIEELVDHLSPEWTAFGKNAKDLGSFAVAATLAANTLAFLWALWGG